jgi:hypothetical protein
MWVGTGEGRSLPAMIDVSASSNSTGSMLAVHVKLSYLWNIKLKLWEFALKFSNVVI